MTPTAPSNWLSPQDLYLFNEGSHVRLYDKMGSHRVTQNGVEGFHFAVWAPNAAAVSVIGDFNEWSPKKNPMQPMGGSGIWGVFIPGVKAFTAAVLGGIGSLPGAVLGGLMIGLIEALWAAYVSSDYKDVAAFSILAVVLIFLPSGLLGRPEVEKV